MKLSTQVLKLPEQKYVPLSITAFLSYKTYSYPIPTKPVHTPVRPTGAKPPTFLHPAPIPLLRMLFSHKKEDCTSRRSTSRYFSFTNTPFATGHITSSCCMTCNLRLGIQKPLLSHPIKRVGYLLCLCHKASLTYPCSHCKAYG